MQSYGHVTIACPELDIAVSPWLDEDPAQITAGYAAWSVVDRDQRRGIPQFDGIRLYEMSLPVLFDGHAQGKSVESDIRLLERMAVVPAGKSKPPEVRVDGPVPRTDLRWLISNLTWGDLIRHPGSGSRHRQAATLTLLQSVEDELVLVTARARRKQTGGKTPRYTHVKRGEDSFADVSKRIYGHRRRGGDIARANTLRYGAKLKIGQKLRLPS